MNDNQLSESSNTKGKTDVNKTKTIIVTGFEPFAGYEYNPSEQIARQLDGYTIEDFVVKAIGDKQPVWYNLFDLLSQVFF